MVRNIKTPSQEIPLIILLHWVGTITKLQRVIFEGTSYWTTDLIVLQHLSSMVIFLTCFFALLQPVNLGSWWTVDTVCTIGFFPRTLVSIVESKIS